MSMTSIRAKFFAALLALLAVFALPGVASAKKSKHHKAKHPQSNVHRAKKNKKHNTHA